METSLSYTDLNTAYFSTDEAYWIRRIKKLAKEHPDDVQITALPEDNYGVLMATLKPRLMKLLPKRVVTVNETETERRRQHAYHLHEQRRQASKNKNKI